MFFLFLKYHGISLDAMWQHQPVAVSASSAKALRVMDQFHLFSEMQGPKV